MDKLKAMRTFVAIADAGSLTAAARVLDGSLPAVVRTLAALEAELGVRLFHRTTRRIAITDAGRRYLERCREAQAVIDDAEAELRAEQTEPEGRLSVTAPVLFGQRLANSQVFTALFREGMALVEETAAYLDGEGRADAKALPRQAALTYATESMRLTTRLLELASWLLIRRALADGDIGEEEARGKRARIDLRASGRPAHIAHFDALPATLRRLIEESLTLSDRIRQIDRTLPQPDGDPEAARANPVAAQIAELRAAFGPLPQS